MTDGVPPPAAAAAAPSPPEPSLPAPLPPERHRVRSLAAPFTERVMASASRVVVMASSMSIRYKIAGALIAVLCLAVAALGMITFGHQKTLLAAEMKHRAEVLVRQVAAAGKIGLLTQDEPAVYATIRDIQQSEGVAYAMVLDSKGAAFAHSTLSEAGRTPSNAADSAAFAATDLLFQDLMLGAEPVLEAALPISSKLGDRALRIGTARVGLSQQSLRAAVRREKLLFGGITLAFVMLGLGIAFAIGRVLTREILVLAAGMEVVAKGDLSRPVHIHARDEIGRLAETFNDMIAKLQEKLKMEKYLSRSTMRLIRRRRDADDIRLGGERCHVAVLFSDVRGFTPLTERMAPEDVVGLLNIYLNLQAEVVHHFGGSVDKFVGDEVMAIFTDDAPEQRAARAAAEIQIYVRCLNGSRQAAGRQPVSVGIGLNCGEVVMGNMGSERQMDYTVIGDPINVAARLCSSAAPGQVLVSRAFAEAVGPDAETRNLGPLPLKGKKQPLDVFEMLGVKGAARLHMRKRTRLDATCCLAGLSEERHAATVVDISRDGCEVQVEVACGVGTQLEVSIPLADVPALSRVRAVVRHVRRAEDSYLLGLQFDGLAEPERDRLTEWVHRV